MSDKQALGQSFEEMPTKGPSRAALDRIIHTFRAEGEHVCLHMKRERDSGWERDYKNTVDLPELKPPGCVWTTNTWPSVCVCIVGDSLK